MQDAINPRSKAVALVDKKLRNLKTRPGWDACKRKRYARALSCVFATIETHLHPINASTGECVMPEIVLCETIFDEAIANHFSLHGLDRMGTMITKEMCTRTFSLLSQANDGACRKHRRKHSNSVVLIMCDPKNEIFLERLREDCNQCSRRALTLLD